MTNVVAMWAEMTRNTSIIQRHEVRLVRPSDTELNRNYWETTHGHQETHRQTTAGHAGKYGSEIK